MMYKLIDRRTVIKDNETIAVLNKKTRKDIREIAALTAEITSAPFSETEINILLDYIIEEHFYTGDISSLAEKISSVNLFLTCLRTRLSIVRRLPF